MTVSVGGINSFDGAGICVAGYGQTAQAPATVEELEYLLEVSQRDIAARHVWRYPVIEPLEPPFYARP